MAWNGELREGTFTSSRSPGKTSLALPGRKSLHVVSSPDQTMGAAPSSSASAAFSQSEAVRGLGACDAPPPPWLELGWIDNFQRLCGTPTVALHAGARGAPAAQFRGSVDARIEFDFREWGKLQMASTRRCAAGFPESAPVPFRCQRNQRL